MYHPFSYSARVYDDSIPSYEEAMSGDEWEYHINIMGLEIGKFSGKKTWTVIQRSLEGQNQMLPSLWEFKKNTYPDGRVRKYEARINEREDIQQFHGDMDDTYSPVVNWLTILILFTLTIILGLSSKKIYIDNTFWKAPLPKPI